MGGEGEFIPLPRGSSRPPRTGLLYFMCAGGACSPRMKVHPMDHIVRTAASLHPVSYVPHPFDRPSILLLVNSKPCNIQIVPFNCI
jgi:hypothetical protein